MKKKILVGVSVLGVCSTVAYICNQLLKKNISEDIGERVYTQNLDSDEYLIPALINNIEVDLKEYNKLFSSKFKTIPKNRLNDVNLLEELDSTIIHCIIDEDPDSLIYLLKSDYKTVFNKNIRNCENSEELFKLIEKSFEINIDLVSLYLSGISYQKIKSIYLSITKNNVKESD